MHQIIILTLVCKTVLLLVRHLSDQDLEDLVEDPDTPADAQDDEDCQEEVGVKDRPKWIGVTVKDQPQKRQDGGGSQSLDARNIGIPQVGVVFALDHRCEAAAVGVADDDGYSGDDKSEQRTEDGGQGAVDLFAVILQQQAQGGIVVNKPRPKDEAS